MDSALVLSIAYGAIVACDVFALVSYWFLLQERNRLARALHSLAEGFEP